MLNLISSDNPVALIDEQGRTTSFEGLRLETEKLVDCIDSERSLVLQVCSNTLASVVGYSAFLRYGHPVALVDEEIHVGKLSELIVSYSPDYVWAPVSKIAEIQESLDYSQAYSFDGYVLLKTNKEAETCMHEDLALLLSTSGSTGTSKFVRLSYKNVLANTEAIVKYLALKPSDRAITSLPMSYAYGLSVLTTHLRAGASIVLTRKSIMQKEFWEQFRENAVTSFSGVPYSFQMLNRLKFMDMDLPCLRYATQAGGKLSPELCERYAAGMREKGQEFFVMYGATEATSRMSYVPPAFSVEKAGSVGIAIPGGRFEIEAGNSDSSTGKVEGELIYYGENVAMGYATSREDLSRGDEWLGRLETGDIAQVDADGFYTIVGRAKRFLKLFGNRINLSEIEMLLEKEGYEAVCGGKDDRLIVYSTAPDSRQEIVGLLERSLKINRTAFAVRYLEEIPRNPAGKVLYSRLDADA